MTILYKYNVIVCSLGNVILSHSRQYEKDSVRKQDIFRLRSEFMTIFRLRSEFMKNCHKFSNSKLLFIIYR